MNFHTWHSYALERFLPDATASWSNGRVPFDEIIVGEGAVLGDDLVTSIILHSEVEISAHINQP
jgi:hypothetical protein